MTVQASIDALKAVFEKEIYIMMPDEVKGSVDITLEAILNLQRGVPPPRSDKGSVFYTHMVERFTQ